MKCPLLSSGQNELLKECIKEGCAWYITPYTIELIPTSCCAIVMIAMKAPAQYQV